MLDSLSNPTSSRRKMKKTKKIRSKATKKYDSSRSDSSSIDYYYFLYSDSENDEIRQPDKHKYTNILDQVVTDNIRNKDQ